MVKKKIIVEMVLDSLIGDEELSDKLEGDIEGVVDDLLKQDKVQDYDLPKIISIDDISKPSKKIFFCVGPLNLGDDENYAVATMVSEKYWIRHHCMDDTGDLNSFLSGYGLIDTMDSVYEHRNYVEGSLEDYHNYLVGCGFEYKRELAFDDEGYYHPGETKDDDIVSEADLKQDVSVSDESEVVIIMGYNAAGKSTLVKEFVDKGYYRINRDETGGSIQGQAELARNALSAGNRLIVLDNTYPDRVSRAGIIEAAHNLSARIKCVWLKTSFEDAQLNACFRMIEKTGRLLQPEDFAKLKDPNLFPPVALFSYRKKFQKPTTAEGFDGVETRNFVRVYSSDYKNKALILDYDGTVRESVGDEKWPQKVDDVKILPNRSGTIGEYARRGYLLLGASNQAPIAKGLPIGKAIECFDRTNELLGYDIDYVFCPHKVPPVTCYCRKPHPGMGAWLICKYKLDPSKCIMVGDQTLDKTFAKRCGFKFEHADKFF